MKVLAILCASVLAVTALVLVSHGTLASTTMKTSKFVSAKDCTDKGGVASGKHGKNCTMPATNNVTIKDSQVNSTNQTAPTGTTFVPMNNVTIKDSQVNSAYKPPATGVVNTVPAMNNVTIKDSQVNSAYKPPATGVVNSVPATNNVVIKDSQVNSNNQTSSPPN